MTAAERRRQRKIILHRERPISLVELADMADRVEDAMAFHPDYPPIIDYDLAENQTEWWAKP